MGSGKCYICGEQTSESNILLNGERYHENCYKNLIEHKTDFDWKFDDIRNRIRANKNEIRQLLQSRSIFQKIIAFIPDRVKTLRKKNEELKVGLSRLQKKKEDIRQEQNQRLFELYTYWPERPPDWPERSRQAREMTTGCENCGRRESYSNPLHVHHKIAISRGGNHSFSNLEVLCSSCHQKHHSHGFGTGQKGGNRNFRDKLNTVEEAQRRNAYLAFKYRRYEGGRDKHYVEVKQIFSKRNATYFRGFCILNNAERDFRVDKIYHTEIKTNKPSKKLPSKYIEEAMEKGKILHFHYTKSNGDKSIRSLDPIGYTKFKGVQVFEGFDYLTDENRCFAPHRMSNIELLDEPKEGKVITGTA